MPLPTVLSDLSTTAASNYPAGTDSPSTLDDVQRAHGAFIAQLRDGTGFTGPVSTITSLSGIRTIQPVTASVGASALTVNIADTSLDFRSATLTTGVPNFRLVTATSLVVPSGATLGTVSAVKSRIVVLALDNAGTVELAVVNISGGVDLSETGLISTTAISSAADSANVIYSTTARTSVPYRVVGFVESTQATAGTWATATSTVQGAGGNALAAMSSIGYGQTWQDVTGSRAAATTYYNTTSKPIAVKVSASNGAGNCSVGGAVGGVALPAVNINVAGSTCETSFLVPPGASYSVTVTGTLGNWSELR